MGKFSGKTAVVTGSGQSIGRSIAHLLASEGASVVVNSRSETSRDQTPTAADTAREIAAAGGRAIPVFADMGTMEGAKAVIDAAVREFGGVDILVNNAGGSHQIANIDEIPEQSWDTVCATNLKSQYACIHYALPHMKKKGWGRIVNISSSVGLLGLAQMTPYAAAKAGTLGLTFALAHETLASGITVNVVLPSAFTTRSDRDRAAREAKTGLSVPRSPERVPEAVAPLVAHLATEEAAGMTGQVFAVSGGRITLHVWPPSKLVLFKPTRWSLDELSAQFPVTFGKSRGPEMPTG